MNNYTNNVQQPAARQTALTLKVLLIIYQHLILAFHMFFLRGRKKDNISRETAERINVGFNLFWC